ncbi:uncharacterized protein LOC115354306 isoform X3 [Myripristis murdjan]|uniref:uncharacterized protein LOC115354306 isoform X3 n=1 Tax=Myripristis murdjan TaxID=586833 RepID=UPI0011760BB6|nr:uncharacterized protein LOC115354306 isoform X3 [Myripristis murdjan]
MLDTEGQWSKALANNNIRAIICWLRNLTTGGDGDIDESLATFSCWVQRTSEFAKKELLTLCFSRCQGLWMCLDQSSFTRVHLLLQRLRNLLTLAQWGRRQLSSAHLWHGVGVPCVLCRETCGCSEARCRCWNREHRALKQHIWLGQLVQWLGITGLLPKYPEAHELKRISQMWREMDHSHRKACLQTPGWEEGGMENWSSFIQGMVAQVDKQHGCIWTSEDYTDQHYPPPNLQALLKLVLVPHIDNMSVQAILMYFILDMANFLQCKDDLLQSFCHAFTIPSSFSQQIRAFWMLDHGHVKASMELLLSPRAAPPWLSWQHRCILHCLLSRRQHRMALRYLLWTRPAMERLQDVKLCADVLLQNGCVYEAWAMLRKGHTERDDKVKYFLQTCKELGLCEEALMCIPEGYNDEDENTNDAYNGTESVLQPRGSQLSVKKRAGGPPCPLSAQLYQAQRMNTVSSKELVKLFRKAVTELRKPQPRISEVVWPEHRERKCSSKELYLSTQALRHLVPSPSPVDIAVRTEQIGHEDKPEEKPAIYNQNAAWAHISSFKSQSMDDLSSNSFSSFTSASSLPLLRQDHPYVYESTLTLQRISALLTDGENESREEESRAASDSDASPECPDLTATLDGTTDLVSLNSSSKDSMEELVLSVEWGEEEEDFLTVDTVSGPSMEEDLPFDKSNEDTQSAPCLFEPQVKSHSFLSPVSEKTDYCKEVSEQIFDRPPDVTDLGCTVLSGNQEVQSHRVPPQIFSFGEAAASCCLMELESLQNACEFLQLEEAVELFCQDSQEVVGQPDMLTSCVLSESTQDLLAELHHSPLLEEPIASGSEALVEVGEQGSKTSSLLFSTCHSLCPTQFQIPGGFLSTATSPTLNAQISPFPADATCKRSPKASLEKEVAYFHSTSDRRGSWWKQGLETPATSGLLPERQHVPEITSERRASLALSRSCSHSLVNFMDLAAKQKGDKREGKQADKEEPAGCRSPGRASHQWAEQGVTGHRRARPRKGKRVKSA